MSYEREGIEVFIGFAGDDASYWSAGEVELLDLHRVPGAVDGLLHGSDIGVESVNGELLVSPDASPEYHVTITLGYDVPDNVAGLFGQLSAVR